MSNSTTFSTTTCVSKRNKFSSGFKFLSILLLVLLVSGKSWGQVSISATGNYSQNFNTLSSTTSATPTWTDNSTISNWYSQRTGNGTTYIVDAGSGTAGGLYSYGSTSNSDRALGTIGSSNAAAGSFAHGVLLRNTSGTTVTDIKVTYTLEEWRKSGVTAAQDITFYYKTSSSAITSLNVNSNSGWTQVTGLTLSSPINTTTAASLDGNAIANRVTATNVSLSGLTLANNDYIMLKWEDPDHTGSDHGLAIDDVTLNWTVSPVVTPASPSGTVGTSFTYNISATNTPTSYALASGTLPAGLSLNTGSGAITGTPTAAGSPSVTVTASNGSGASTAATLSFTISKGSSTVTATGTTSYTYTGSAQGPASNTFTGSTSTVTYSYSGVTPTVYSASATAPTNVGTYQVIATLPTDANYNAATSAALPFTIGVATPTVTPTVGTYTYTGSAQGPNAATNTGTGSSYTYSYVNVGGTSYGPSSTAPTNAGSYTVTVTVGANGNYGSASSSATAFSIVKASSSITAIGSTNFLYDGSTHGPSTSTKSGSDGAVTYSYSGTGVTTYTASSTPPTEVGTYQVIATVAANSNYNGADSSPLAFSITSTPVPVISSTLTASATYGIAASTYTITASGTPTSYSATGLPSGLSVDTSTGDITGTSTVVGLFHVTIGATNVGGTGTATLDYTINAKPLTVTSAAATSKEYNRTNAAVITGTLSGKVGGDVVTLNGTGTFAQTGIGTGIAVTSTSTLGGADAAKYTLTQPTGLTADITAKALTVSGASVTTKTYTGTNPATITGATLVGIIAPDAVTVSGGGTFADVNVANGISVTPSLSLGGADAGNYTLTQPTLTGNITTATLTITGVSGVSRPYNGGTTATIAGTPAYVGLQNGETFTVTGSPTFSFVDATAVNSKSITIGGGGYTAPSANYTVTQPTLSADITKVALTITAGNQSVPNGTAVATVTSAGSYTATGFVNSENAATVITGSATYTTTYTIATAAGTSGVTITPVVTSLIAANYSFTPADGTITVTAAPTVIAGWDFNGLSGYGSSPMAASSSNSNFTVGGLTRGSGLGTSGTAASSSWGATTWTSTTSTDAITANQYATFSISPNSGNLVSLTSISAYNIKKSKTGATTTLWQYQINSGSFVDIGSPIVWGVDGTATTSAQTAINLSGISNLQNISAGTVVTFRIVNYGATATTGTWYIYDPTATAGNDLIINGVVGVPATPPDLTADASANTVDNNIDITFTDNATWRGKITAVKIGSTALTATTDYVITAGNIQLKPSGHNVLLTTSGSKSITVVATGYSDTTPLTQAINAGAPTSNSTATISAVLAPSATRTVTCTAKDQYNNLVSGYTFKYAATIANVIATTNESYTIDGSAITTTATNSITATTNGSGVATFDATLPATIDATDGISLQVKLADGTTSIGSAFAYHELPSQTISFGTLSNPTYGDAPYTISATGGGSGNPVVFTSSNSAIATCSGTNGTTITVIAPGNCTIYANQAGNSSYNAAPQASQSLTVDKKALTIDAAAATGKVYDGNTTATITGTLSSRIGADVVSLSLSGTYADANVADGKAVTSTSTLGSADAAKYTLTQPTGLTANITQATQTISFGAITTKIVGAAPFTLTQNASSGLAISYASSNESVATVSGNTVTIVGIGSTDITASQAGDVNHSAATNVIRTLVVTAVPVAAWDFTGVGSTSLASLAATTFSTDLVSTTNASEITRGGTAGWSNAGNSFRTTGFQDNSISTSNTDYFQVTLAPKTGKSVSLSTIDANFAGTSGFYASPGVTSQFAYSLNGNDFTLIGSPVQSTSLSLTQVDLSTVTALQNVLPGTTITLRYYASGQTTSGGWGFYSASSGSNGLAIGGKINEYISSSVNATDLSDCPTCNVIVSGTGTLNLDATKTYNSIVVNPNGQVSLGSGKTLNVGTLTLQSSASGTATLVDNGGTLNATTTHVEQYLTTGRNWYISSPVAAAPSSVVSASVTYPLYWYKESLGSTLPWIQITNSDSTFNVLKGYVTNVETEGAVTFSGPLNTGEKSITLRRTTGQTKEGFNLVGNPYPSYLDWDQVSKTNLLTSIWYRSKNNIIDPKTGKTSYVFDTYNSDGQIGTGNNGAYVNNHIPPMQSFWVRVQGASQATLTVNNTMRSHKGSQDNRLSVVNDGIFKSKSTVTKSVLRLQVSNGTNTDEAVIYSNPGASNSFDNYDSPKMFNNTASIAEIYTVAGNEQLAINGLNTIPYDTEMNLGFSTVTAGTYSLKASQFSNFESGVRVVIKDYLDKNNPVTTDLSDGTTSYSFTSEATTNTSRFTLVFKAPSVATGINSDYVGNVWLSTNADGQILINGVANAGTMVAVYNEVGQKLVSESLTSTTKVLSSRFVPGVYMVTVSNTGKNITKKLIVK